MTCRYRVCHFIIVCILSLFRRLDSLRHHIVTNYNWYEVVKSKARLTQDIFVDICYISLDNVLPNVGMMKILFTKFLLFFFVVD